MAQHNEIGVKGELVAKKFLEDNGYTVCETNWRSRHLEIDLVAKKENTLIIIEVKTRKSNYFGEPEEWVSRQKQKNLMAATNAYIEKNELDMEVRFDIISVIYSGEGTKINHIQDAFSAVS